MNAQARIVLALVASATACRRTSTPSPPALVQRAAAGSAARSPAAHHFPATPGEMPATAAAIAVPNFEGFYRLALESARTQPGRPPAALVNAALMHAQYFGTLDDYDRALAAAGRVVALAPRQPEAYLARAGARQALHDFSGALADLARARRLGGDSDDIEVARAGILQALGRYDEALPLREHAVARAATITSLAALAQLVAEMGDVTRAEALFGQAQEAYGDVSPFALAWLYFQAGLVEERAGRPAMARDLYRAAHERLPEYAAAAAHLAGLAAKAGDTREATALLEALVARADDPEYAAALGDLVMKSGDTARAKALVDGARTRYDELLARHPAAFADHAARFFLGPGGDAARALALARRNLRLRPTRDAYELAIVAALAAHDDAAACRYADAGSRLRYAGPALAVRAAEAFARCGRLARR